MPDALVRDQSRGIAIPIRINGADPTFTLLPDTIRRAAIAEIDDRALDFLEIASCVFAADGSFKRGGVTRQHMGEAWHRDLAFRIPVRQPCFWSRPDVTSALEAATEFLMGDSVAFEFEAAGVEDPREPYFAFEPETATFAADEVILFSGGLDSFAGALEALGTTSDRVILLTHRSAQKAMPRQVKLGAYLANRFPGRVLHLNVLARRKRSEAADTTQRSRTLLFAALGLSVAGTFGARKLSFYENGIVSHNLPFSQQIVGTMASRTTHPLSLHLLNELVALVWPDAPRIENRYQWLTKTDVVRRIAEHGGAEEIPRTVSCTSIRDQTRRHTHCGSCTQCLDRRFAVLAAGHAGCDMEEDYLVDVLYGARNTTQSRTHALEWTRHACRLGKLDATGALTEFGLELSRIGAGHPDLSLRDAVQRTLEMHKRHADAVMSVLTSAIRERAGELARQELPCTCLLSLHAGGAAREDDRTGIRLHHGARDRSDETGEALELDPTAPLHVAFYQRKGAFVVRVKNLGEVTGNPAMVAHGLKAVFDEDRAAGRSPEDHRHCHCRDLPGCNHFSMDTFRQHVTRCRKELADFHEAIHGEPPGRHLLIENKPRSGYRLDPHTVPFAPPDED